jgi:hypothetical protein
MKVTDVSRLSRTEYSVRLTPNRFERLRKARTSFLECTDSGRVFKWTETPVYVDDKGKMFSYFSKITIALDKYNNI